MARKTAIIKKNQERAVIIGAGITERWYFSHMQSLFGLKVKIRPRYFGTSKAVIAELVKFIPKFDKCESFLSNKKWVEELCQEGKFIDACTRSKQIGSEGDSYSNLWKAFDYLGVFVTKESK